MTAAAPKVTVHVVDDDRGICRSITKALQVSGYTAFAHESVEGFFANFGASIPTVIIVDMRMPLASGLDLMRRARTANILAPIIILSGESSTYEAVSTLKEGAYDFLFKPVSLPDLLRAVASAAKWDQARVDIETQQQEFIAKYKTLTLREAELCASVAQDARLREISQRFGISEATAKIHKARILAKLEASSPAELALKLAKFIPEQM